jgi:hypothetical protein
MLHEGGDASAANIWSKIVWTALFPRSPFDAALAESQDLTLIKARNRSSTTAPESLKVSPSERGHPRRVFQPKQSILLFTAISLLSILLYESHACRSGGRPDQHTISYRFKLVLYLLDSKLSPFIPQMQFPTSFIVSGTTKTLPLCNITRLYSSSSPTCLDQVFQRYSFACCA